MQPKAPDPTIPQSLLRPATLLNGTTVNIAPAPPASEDDLNLLVKAILGAAGDQPIGASGFWAWHAIVESALGNKGVMGVARRLMEVCVEPKPTAEIGATAADRIGLTIQCAAYQIELLGGATGPFVKALLGRAQSWVGEDVNLREVGRTLLRSFSQSDTTDTTSASDAAPAGPTADGA